MSIWSDSRASLLLAGRNSRTISAICSLVSISRVSLPCASNSASFLRSSASSRLRWKDSDRRGISRGSGRLVFGGVVVGTLAEERVAFGLVDNHLQPDNGDVVAHLGLQLHEVAPRLVVVVPVDDALHQLRDGQRQVGLGGGRRAHRCAPVAAVARAKVTRGMATIRSRPASSRQLICSVCCSSNTTRNASSVSER